MRTRRKSCNRARDVCRWMRRSRPEFLEAKWRSLGVHTSILHLRCSHRSREVDFRLDTLPSTSAGRYLRSILKPHLDRLKELVLFDQDRRRLNAKIAEDLDTGISFAITDPNGKKIGSYKISSELLADDIAGSLDQPAVSTAPESEGVTERHSVALDSDFRSDGNDRVAGTDPFPVPAPPPPSRTSTVSHNSDESLDSSWLSVETDSSDSGEMGARSDSNSGKESRYEPLPPKCLTSEPYHSEFRPSAPVSQISGKHDIMMEQAGIVRRTEPVYRDQFSFEEWVRNHLPGYLERLENKEYAASLFQAAKNLANRELVDPSLHSALRSAFRQMKASGSYRLLADESIKL